MDLADLKRELRRLEASAYSPRDALAAAEAAVVYRTLPAFEARMLESHGFLAEAEPWKNKLARLDSATAADVGRLRVLLDDLGVARFRRFFAAMIIGAWVLPTAPLRSTRGRPTSHFAQVCDGERVHRPIDYFTTLLALAPPLFRRRRPPPRRLLNARGVVGGIHATNYIGRRRDDDIRFAEVLRRLLVLLLNRHRSRLPIAEASAPSLAGRRAAPRARHIFESQLQLPTRVAIALPVMLVVEPRQLRDA